VIHRIPSGTRDVLPDELRELRAITEGIRGVFSGRGYGEVSTPALEYEEVLVRGDAAAADPAYKLFDEHGDVLALRSDMTIPIARVVASRYPSAEPPLRFCYFAHAYRSVQSHRGQPREMLQAGIELVGAPGPEGTAEALTVLCESLEAAGLENWRIGLGDASLYPRLLDRVGVPEGARPQILHELVTRDYVGLAREVEAFGAPELLELPQRRGGPEVLGAPETEPLGALHGMLPEAVAGRIIFDLGLTRPLSYYTGAVFEVYDAALGTPIGGGGRYDDLLGRFGRALPACGWALDVERLHAARVGEGR
jgi:ATP phosphoribosyltransferase regulatory subunit